MFMTPSIEGSSRFVKDRLGPEDCGRKIFLEAFLRKRERADQSRRWSFKHKDLEKNFY